MPMDNFNPTPVDSCGPVITVTVDTNGFACVRWYSSVWTAERNDVMLTACAVGVSVHTRYLHEIPETWLESAKEAHVLMREQPEVDVSHLATHVNSVTSNGPLVPVGTTNG